MVECDHDFKQIGNTHVYICNKCGNELKTEPLKITIARIVKGKVRTVFKSKKLDFKDDESVNFYCKEIARKLCGKHKRSEMLLITGAVGTGKSYTAMEIARLISIYMAELDGDDPEDHFPSDLSHMAIINDEELRRVFQLIGKRKHCIYVLDDFGEAYGSRDFMSKSNRAVNSLIQTWRVDESCIIVTVPMGSLIDKVGRELMSHVAEMLQPIFDRQVNVTDIRTVKPQRKGEPRYPYMQDGMGNKIKRHTFAKPPQDWCDRYDHIRAEQTKILREKKQAIMFQDEDGKVKDKKPSQMEVYRQAAKEYNPDIHGSKKDYCKSKGFNYGGYINATS